MLGKDGIDIDLLTESELHDLNRKIVERLKFLHKMRAHQQMLEFSIGEKVWFMHEGRKISGTITRYNQRTVTIHVCNQGNWKVSPGLLKRDAIDGEAFQPEQSANNQVALKI